MPEIHIKNKSNNTVGKMELRDDVFGVDMKPTVVHQAIVNFLANQRQKRKLNLVLPRVIVCFVRLFEIDVLR